MGRLNFAKKILLDANPAEHVFFRVLGKKFKVFMQWTVRARFGSFVVLWTAQINVIIWAITVGTVLRRTSTINHYLLQATLAFFSAIAPAIAVFVTHENLLYEC